MQMNCDEINYPSSILSEFGDDQLNFTINVPESWISKITDGTDKFVRFSDTLYHSTDFETLYIGQTVLPKRFNLDDEFGAVFKLIEQDTNIVILDNGTCIIDDLKGKWVLSDNFSFKTDSLDAKDLHVLISSDKNYYSISASVYGNNETEERMCKLINLLYTFEEK